MQAYDSVDRQVLWKKLQKIGIRGKFLNMLQAMYTGDSVDTEVNGVPTKSMIYFLLPGVPQVCRDC